MLPVCLHVVTYGHKDFVQGRAHSSFIHINAEDIHHVEDVSILTRVSNLKYLLFYSQHEHD